MRCGRLDVVVKPVLDRRPGGELGVGPEAQDGRGQDVGAGMADALQVGHFLPVIQCFPVILHAANLTIDRPG